MTLTAEEIVKQLNLLPHPEGGYFKETYRSAGSIPESALGSDFTGSRQFSTAIYFLLKGDQVSHFHRIKADEVWHYYDGSPLEVIELDESGGVHTTLLGRSLDSEQSLQHVVPAGRWFGARLQAPDPEAYALVGCTVAPGFDFQDFELATKETLKSYNLSTALQELVIDETPKS